MLTSSSSKSIDVFILIGIVLYYFIVPIVQVSSVIYGINNVNKHLNQPVNAATVSPLLLSCKRSTIVYFIFMALLVVVISPMDMTHNYYDSEYIDYFNYATLTDNGQQTYSLFVFNRFTVHLFFNLSVACYLSVVLLFTSLRMMQINTIQDEIILILSTKY